MEDSILRKLQKIQALAERGEDGEKESAKVMLDKLLREYNLKLEDIVTEQTIKYKLKYRNSFEKKLYMQIISQVLDSTSVTYWKGDLSMTFELTPLQYEEVKDLFRIYKKAFEEEMDRLFTAFIHKHELFAATPSGNTSSKEPMSQKEWLKLMSMMESLKDVKRPLRKNLLGE